MGLLGLFSKDGRETKRTKLEYEECRRERQKKLLSYRNNAIQDILFKYPDAKLLLNRLDRRFMVILPRQGSLLWGKFADDYYPKLDYIVEPSNTAEMRAAITKFRFQVGRCVGNISEESMPRFKDSCRWRPQRITTSFQTKGYSDTGEFKLNYLIGGALFLNGQRIAKASIWDVKPKGYFNNKLFEMVVQNADRRPGIQVLNFVTAFSGPVGGGAKTGYEIIFDKSINQFNINNPDEFTVSILNIKDFLYTLEDYFRPGCPGGFDDKIGYTNPASESMLETAVRPRDQSSDL